jgi:hypothetical protein
MHRAPFQQKLELSMALYKYSTKLQQSSDVAFDGVLSPGNSAPFSGIYRCLGCAKEVASNAVEPLPPQNHHQHSTSQGSVRWNLIVYAEHNPS